MMALAELHNLLGPPDSRRVYGVMVGIVTNNKDPKEMGRVKVKFPSLSDDYESQWARVLTPMAGNGMGLYYLPEVDDEVIIGFENGIIEYPYVLGAVWNGKDKPPESNSDGKNNMRTLKSRSGHRISLDDSSGAEKIEIVDKTGHNKIVISAADNTISINADADITIQSSRGKLKLSGVGVEITSTTDVKIQGAVIKLN